MTTSRFVIRTDARGEFRFNLEAANGQVILSSEGYTTKANCLNGVESVRRHASEEHRFERTISRSGSYHFNLKAANGQVVGTSQMYERSADMEQGIRSVMAHAPAALVLEA
jgi:uncharacterized protein YegP (UPF0339 family)